MRIAPTLRGKQGATEPGQVTTRPLVPVPNLPPGYINRPYVPSWSVHKAVAEGFERVVWLFRCCVAMADAWSWLRIYQQQGRWGSEIDDLDAWDTVRLLNDRPNRYEIAANFKKRVTILSLLSKEGVFIENVPSNDGGVAELHILPPGYTHPIPGGDFVAGYSVWIPGTNRVDLAPERVTWVKFPHPINPYMSYTPLEAAGLAIDTDYWARVFNRNFMRNDRRPAGIVGVHGEMVSGDADELYDRFNNGTPGRISVVETVVEQTDGSRVPGGGLDYVQLGAAGSDAQYMEMRKWDRDEIIAAFGYPDSVVTGNASGKTFANADAERLMFNQGPVRQHASTILSHFDELDPDPTRFLAADHSVIPEIQAAENERRTTGLDELGKGAILIDEYRVDYAHREPYPNGAGQTTLVPINLVPLAGLSRAPDATPATPDSEPVTPDAPAGDPAEEPIDVTASMTANGHKSHAVGAGTAVAELVRTELLEAALDDAASKAEDGRIAFGPHSVDAQRLTNVKRVADRTFRNWETHVRGLLVDYFKRQERLTLEKLRAARTLSGTRHWMGKTIDRAGKQTGKAIDAGNVFDRGMWDGKLHDLAGAWQENIFETYGEATLANIRGSKAAMPDTAAVFVTGNERTLTWLAAARKRITRINDTTWEAIRDQLLEGEAAGEGIDALADRIQSVFSAASDIRAETIARTEVLAASNAGSLEGAVQSGVVTGKAWLAVDDERTREAHAEADGQTVALDDSYDVGGEQLDYPGDPNGSPDNVINCFPAETPIESPLIQAAYRRFYEGPMFTVRTRSGRVLTATPNHPVLTNRGWVPLCALHQGDHLVRGSLVERMRLGQPDVERGPTSIGEAFQSLSIATVRQRVVGSSVDFHGDGRDGEVDVVRSHRKLRNRRQAARAEHREKFPLAFTDEPRSALVRQSASSRPGGAYLGRVTLSESRAMRRSDLPSPLLDTHPAPLRPFSFGASTRVDSRRYESPSNPAPSDPIQICKGLLRLAGDIALDEVIDIDVQSWSGHVFNLSSVYGWYLADGLVAHNCRCSQVFATGDDGEEGDLLL